MVIVMRLTSYRIKLLSTLILCFASSFALGNTTETIGSITSQKGNPAQITRDGNNISTEQGTGLVMDDEIITAKTKLGLTFIDDTRVSVTEQSVVVIDDFIYDPSTGTGKLAMNIALGTVKYSSGAIARNSRENVSLKTPTATISVRGTDFTMTVDELGRSIIILLPSCPPVGDCWTGEIMVSTEVGQVILNQAYQATLVSNRMANPTKPKILDITEANIDNMLIITPPPELKGVGYIAQAEVAEYLDSELLEYAELNSDELEEDKLELLELDVNRLDIDFLFNVLDATAMLQDDELAIDPVLPTYNTYRTTVQAFYDEDKVGIYSESSVHISDVTTERVIDGDVNMYKDGVPALIQVNGGGDVIINITQNQ
jgi:hypothetical protein